MKNLQYFLILLFSSFSLLRSEQLPGMNSASTVKSDVPSNKTPVISNTKPTVSPVAKPIVAQPVPKPVVPVKSAPVVAVTVEKPVVAAASKPVVAVSTARPVVATPVAKPISQVQEVQVAPTTPVQAPEKSVVVPVAPSFTKLPLQINIKNNAKTTAHITGFSVVYQGKTVQSNMYLALEPNEEKHFTFNLKIANNTNQNIHYPYVSTILIDGQTVLTNYQKTPIGHTLQVLQITKKKNGLWALDAKAMKKIKDIVSSEPEVDQSSLREGIVTTVAQTRAKVGEKTNKKNIKKSKSNQSAKKIINK